MNQYKNEIEKWHEPLTKSKETFSKGHWDKKDFPYIPSSNMSEAFLIGLNWLYHAGRLPFAMKKSRGYSWIVEGLKVTILDSFNHREGLKIESI